MSDKIMQEDFSQQSLVTNGDSAPRSSQAIEVSIKWHLFIYIFYILY